MIRHYQDISHFRAPYKNATVQGYDGLGVYDFVEEGSPVLHGFGAPAPSERDPRVLINKWYADPVLSNPENVSRDLVSNLKRMVVTPRMEACGTSRYGDVESASCTTEQILQVPIRDTFATLFAHGGTSAQAQEIVGTTLEWMKNQAGISKYAVVESTELLTVMGVLQQLVEVGRQRAMLQALQVAVPPPPPVPPVTSTSDRGFYTQFLPPAPVPVVRPTTAGPAVSRTEPYVPQPTKSAKSGQVTSRPLTAAEKAAIRGEKPVVYEGPRISDGDAAIFAHFAQARRDAEEKAAAEKAAAEEGKMPSWVLPAAIGAVGLVVAVAILKK